MGKHSAFYDDLIKETKPHPSDLRGAQQEQNRQDSRNQGDGIGIGFHVKLNFGDKGSLWQRIKDGFGFGEPSPETPEQDKATQKIRDQQALIVLKNADIDPKLFNRANKHMSYEEIAEVVTQANKDGENPAKKLEGEVKELEKQKREEDQEKAKEVAKNNPDVKKHGEKIAGKGVEDKGHDHEAAKEHGASKKDKLVAQR